MICTTAEYCRVAFSNLHHFDWIQQHYLALPLEKPWPINQRNETSLTEANESRYHLALKQWPLGDKHASHYFSTLFSYLSPTLFSRSFWISFQNHKKKSNVENKTWILFFTFLTTLSLSGAWSKSVSKASRSGFRRGKKNKSIHLQQPTMGSRLCVPSLKVFLRKPHNRDSS